MCYIGDIRLKRRKKNCENMDANDFREFGRAAIDFVADYLENVQER